MNKRKNDEFDEDSVRAYMKLPVQMKLKWLEEMNGFLNKLTSQKSKKIAERLKKEGF